MKKDNQIFKNTEELKEELSLVKGKLTDVESYFQGQKVEIELIKSVLAEIKLAIKEVKDPLPK